MPPVLVELVGCQAGAYCDNEVIPPGAPRPKLPWVHISAFDALLAAYPYVHPEDFVMYGILQAQPRRGSYREWGEVAGVLSHLVGGKRALANELSLIIHRIQRLDRDDPMRATEETTLVDVIRRERVRSAVPLGDGAYPLLAPPGGPLACPTLPGPTGAPRDPRRHQPQSSSTSDPETGPSGAQGRPGCPKSLRPGPSGTQGRHQRQQPPPGSSGARGEQRRPPPGFPEIVDLTTDTEEEMDEAPATPFQ